MKPVDWNAVRVAIGALYAGRLQRSCVPGVWRAFKPDPARPVVLVERFDPAVTS